MIIWIITVITIEISAKTAAYCSLSRKTPFFFLAKKYPKLPPNKTMVTSMIILFSP